MIKKFVELFGASKSSAYRKPSNIYQQMWIALSSIMKQIIIVILSYRGMSWRTADMATDALLSHKCNRNCIQIGMYLMNDYLLFNVLYSWLSLAVSKL